MHKIKILICSALLCIIFSGTALAVKPIYSGGKDRAAVRGYDVVAYFTENVPVKGNQQNSLEYAEATWLFSNQANLEVFKANPDKYMPQYGGYCAYAVARNSTASIKPEFFTIHDGKLYLNYSKSVFKKWNKKKEQYISDADQKWPKLLDK